MVDRNDRNFSQNEHTFIKETIKEPPINKKGLRRSCCWHQPVELHLVYVQFLL